MCREAAGLRAPAGLCGAGLLFLTTRRVGREAAGKLVGDLLIVEQLDDDLERAVRLW